MKNETVATSFDEFFCYIDCPLIKFFIAELELRSRHSMQEKGELTLAHKHVILQFMKLVSHGGLFKLSQRSNSC